MLLASVPRSHGDAGRGNRKRGGLVLERKSSVVAGGFVGGIVLIVGSAPVGGRR